MMIIVLLIILYCYLIIILLYVTVLGKRGLLVGFAEFAFLISLESTSNAL